MYISVTLHIFFVDPFKCKCRKVFSTSLYKYLLVFKHVQCFFYGADCVDELMFASFLWQMKNSDVMLEQNR